MTERGRTTPSGRRRPAMQARDKLNLLLVLVPWLMDHDRVTVTEAAANFDVDEQTIRDAVELIAVSGIPGETAAYQHGDLFDIAWDDFEERGEIVLTNLVAIDDSPRFSAKEAAALIAGLQYLSSLPENTDRAALATLEGKLSRGASAAPPQVGVENAESDGTLALIRQAVDRGVQLELDYRGADSITERRRVDPLRVESVDTDWYLRGWCHLREAVRTFRLDRMSDVVVTDEPISHRESDVTLPDTLFQGSPDDIPVTIEVAASAMPLLADYLPADAVSSTHGDLVRTTLRVTSVGALTRLIAGMPGVGRVIDPEDARSAVRAWSSAALARYRG